MCRKGLLEFEREWYVQERSAQSIKGRGGSMCR